jgi:secreted PhoX family phosphatase
MLRRPSRRLALLLAVAAAAVTAGVAALTAGAEGSGKFTFTPIPNESACLPDTHGADPITLPPGFTQQVIASEPSYADVPDMNTLNETGPQAGRFLYQPHEVNSNGSLSRIDLNTGNVQTVAQRDDWERLDGVVWTKWGTVLFAEETNAVAQKDPAVPQAEAGLVYEFDPATGSTVPRPALGSKSHEGMRFDAQGNLYSISESNPGYIFRFTPDHKGDLSSGQLSVLKVTTPTGPGTGEAEWVPLDRTAVQVNATAVATAAQATTYNRPEDVELGTSTGNAGPAGGGETLFVAVTETPPEDRVVAVDLREPAGGGDHSTAFVYDYVKVGLNASAQFEWPDNLALDHSGNLFITEDKPNPTADGRPDDIWVATPPKGGQDQPAADVVRFASLKECSPEPTGIYFDKDGGTLYVNIQHRGGDGMDKTVAVTPTH